jgi:hypothetical protein
MPGCEGMLEASFKAPCQTASLRAGRQISSCCGQTVSGSGPPGEFIRSERNYHDFLTSLCDESIDIAGSFARDGIFDYNIHAHVFLLNYRLLDDYLQKARHAFGTLG